MAFRPTSNLIEGILDNTISGTVRGWVDFFRQGKEPLHCTLEFDGDFHDDVRGRILHFWNEHPSDSGCDGSLGRIEPEYIESMRLVQKGNVGDVTINHHGTVYIEWYSESNGRVVLNIDQTHVEILGDEVDLATLPPRKSHPDAFGIYLREMGIAFRKSSKNPDAIVLGLGDSGLFPGDDAERN